MAQRQRHRLEKGCCRVNEHWMMIPCRSAHALLSQRMDRELELGERLRLRVHLGLCRMCSRVEGQMDLIRAALRRLGKD
jgi:hypothetical protein